MCASCFLEDELTPHQRGAFSSDCVDEKLKRESKTNEVTEGRVSVTTVDKPHVPTDSHIYRRTDDSGRQSHRHSSFSRSCR